MHPLVPLFIQSTMVTVMMSAGYWTPSSKYALHSLCPLKELGGYDSSLTFLTSYEAEATPSHSLDLFTVIKMRIELTPS